MLIDPINILKIYFETAKKELVNKVGILYRENAFDIIDSFILNSF